MELYVKNIGKVAEASVEIKGISVIAGENDTGKSTIGRVLYSVFNSFYEIEKQIKEERKFSIRNALEILLYRHNASYALLDSLAKEILMKSEEYKKEPKQLERDIMSYFDSDLPFDTVAINREELYSIRQNILEVLNVSEDAVFQAVINRKMAAEFNNELLNIDAKDNGKIILKIRHEEITVVVSKEEVAVEEIKCSLRTEAIYIDDPFILDDMDLMIGRRRASYFDHRIQLMNKLAFENRNAGIIDELVIENKLEKIYEKLSSVCDGYIIRQKNGRIRYRLKDSGKTLNVKNLSTGLKTFAILKALLINGTLTAGGTIILDEPEIHLHPEWQLVFAELIVLLHKEFGMHILLNTHSPYFLRSIQVYSAKYEMSDICKYYLSETMDDGMAYIRDVTDDIDKIYTKLYRPLQKLEDERGNND